MTQNSGVYAASLEAIRASAGSGKTYALTTRYLNVLDQGGPDGILATTFTRKAAGEILGRVLRRLAEAASDERSCRQLAVDLEIAALTPAECQSRLTRLCRSLHRVSISTLDSFFSRLSTNFRHELETPLDARIVEPESPAAVALRERAIRALLQEAGSEQLIAWLDQLQEGMAQRSVQGALDELFRELYEIFGQTGPEAWNQLQVPPDVPDAVVAAALAALSEIAAAPPGDRLSAAIAKDITKAVAGDWLALLTTGIAPKLLDGSRSYYRKPLPDTVTGPYDVLVQRATAVLLRRNADQTQATYELLRNFDQHYTAVRQQQRSLLFSDVPRALARVLPGRNLAEIAYRMDTRIDHLLLDEFQDTSPEQWQVLRPFAERIHDLVDARASIFCVGDVKQAIYSWRGGCAEIFDRLERDLTRLSWRSMDDSYRSSQVILDAVHGVFRDLRRNPVLAGHQAAADAWQERYERHTAKKELPGYVELITSPGAGSTADSDEAADGVPVPLDDDPLAYAAIRVTEIVEQAPAASVGVLLRTNAAVRQMLFYLQQRGIEASGEGGGTVDDAPEVEVILSALTLADHPGDTAAAYHVASSPLAPTFDLPQEEIPAPRQRTRASRRIRQELVTRGYAAVVCDWARLLARAADGRGAHRLTQLVELADQLGREPGLRPAEFVRGVRSTTVEEQSPARVRVMSIHRAKGLEFDVVVLPELQKRLGQLRGPVLVDRPDPTGPIEAVYRAANDTVRSLAPQLQAAYTRQQQAEVQESLCLLYVAMTRARHALHLVIPPQEATQAGTARQEGLTYASLLRATLGDPAKESFAGGETLYRAGDPQWMQSCNWPAATQPPDRELPELRLAPPGAAGRARREVTPSSLEGGGRVRVADLLSPGNRAGQDYGTLMHAWFAEVSWLDEPLPDTDHLLRVGTHAVPGQDASWYVARLAEWREWLQDPEVHDALTRPEDCEVDLWREQRFAVRLGETLLHGSFDRVEIQRSGATIQRVELLDYKTDHVDAAAVPARAEVYRPQLDAYRAALAAMLRIDPGLIRARLRFLRPRIWVEVGNE